MVENRSGSFVAKLVSKVGWFSIEWLNCLVVILQEIGVQIDTGELGYRIEEILCGESDLIRVV